MTVMLIHQHRKGEVVEGWKVLSVQQNVGANGDKHLHLVVFEKGGITDKALEVSENGSQFLHFISKPVSFAVLSPGRDGKESWIKIEDNFLKQHGNGAGTPSARQMNDLLFLSRDAYKWAVSLAAADVIRVDDIEAKAEDFARGSLSLAKNLSED